MAALAALERGSASAGEIAAAEWVAARMRDCGADGPEVRPYLYSRTYAHAHALHFAAALAGRIPALAALVSYDLDYSGRNQWLRRLLPRHPGAYSLARVPARGERRRTLVLVAHHDTARTGLVWRLPVSRPIGRTGLVPSFALVPELAMLIRAVGRGRLRAAAAAALVANVLLVADVARSPAVPGANDDASGVAALLALLAEWAPHGLPGTEVIAVSVGSEESGMGGMAAWMRDEGAALDPASTLVLSLDTLGCGEPIVARGEGLTASYRSEDLDWLPSEVPRVRIGGWTDAILARHAGLPALSLLSRGPDGGFTDYHLPSDVPENVDFDSVERCLAVARAIALRFAG